MTQHEDKRGSGPSWATWTALAAVTAVVAVGTSAQDWSWPERAENLQVLPADTPPDELRDVMLAFTRSLGVRCSYCHVGTEGHPLSTYDFASDGERHKEVAREMMRMLDGVREDLEKVGAEPEEVGCYTCHRGRSHPSTLRSELRDAYAAGGIDAAIEHYGQLREDYYGSGSLDFGEPVLDVFGRQLQDEDPDAAIAVFHLNAEHHPDSPRAWARLAAAYAATGKTESAEALYLRALALDPGNERLIGALRELRAAQVAGD